MGGTPESGSKSGVVPRFDVITLFPDDFTGLLNFGVVGRAQEQGLWSLKVWNPRDFTTDPHRTVDDRPYGGGPGMVMLAQPLVNTLAAVRAERSTQMPGDHAPVVFLTPHGPLLKQAEVRSLSAAISPGGCILLCGRYEGLDQRFIDHYVDRSYCLGDFVMSGGELPVACLIDAWVRLLPGTLNSSQSAVQDSFEIGFRGGSCSHSSSRPDAGSGVVPALVPVLFQALALLAALLLCPCSIALITPGRKFLKKPRFLRCFYLEITLE
ncbi:MAG: tRNA (guanosine(37)-N1)-methyltransferase TrmD [Limnobacter sp.]|nr:tRNA (guanosine(37)-N1)-methyltransferase TrmD [Limnobacter sp.]